MFADNYLMLLHVCRQLLDVTPCLQTITWCYFMFTDNYLMLLHVCRQLHDITLCLQTITWCYSIFADNYMMLLHVCRQLRQCSSWSNIYTANRSSIEMSVNTLYSVYCTRDASNNMAFDNTFCTSSTHFYILKMMTKVTMLVVTCDQLT